MIWHCGWGFYESLSGIGLDERSNSITLCIATLSKQQILWRFQEIVDLQHDAFLTSENGINI